MSRAARKERKENKKIEIKAKLITALRETLAKTETEKGVPKAEKIAQEQVRKEYPAQERAVVEEAFREFQGSEERHEVLEQAKKCLAEGAKEKKKAKVKAKA